jgi:hypothetical protein
MSLGRGRYYRHGRACPGKSGLPDLPHRYYAEVGQAPTSSAIHVFTTGNEKDVDARHIGVRMHAVLRTAMAGHDA